MSGRWYHKRSSSCDEMNGGRLDQGDDFALLLQSHVLACLIGDQRLERTNEVHVDPHDRTFALPPCPMGSPPTRRATLRSAGAEKTCCTGPLWHTRPASKSARWSPSASASMRSCVTNRAEILSSTSQIGRASWRER